MPQRRYAEKPDGDVQPDRRAPSGSRRRARARSGWGLPSAWGKGLAMVEKTVGSARRRGFDARSVHGRTAPPSPVSRRLLAHDVALFDHGAHRHQSAPQGTTSKAAVRTGRPRAPNGARSDREP